MRKDRSSSSRDETNDAHPKDYTSVGVQVETAHEEASNRAAKATKERRCILKLSPSEATIPGPPDNYTTTPGFWYYGWPLFQEDVERILKQLRGYAVDMSGTPNDFLVGNLLFLLDKGLGYKFHVVYVKSDGSPQNTRPLPEPFLPYASGPCFFGAFQPNHTPL